MRRVRTSWITCPGSTEEVGPMRGHRQSVLLNVFMLGLSDENLAMSLQMDYSKPSYVGHPPSVNELRAYVRRLQDSLHWEPFQPIEPPGLEDHCRKISLPPSVSEPDYSLLFTIILHQILRPRPPQFEYATRHRCHFRLCEELRIGRCLESRDEQLRLPLLPMEECW